MTAADAILFWVHGLAVWAFFMNLYWRGRITRLERRQETIRDALKGKP